MATAVAAKTPGVGLLTRLAGTQETVLLLCILLLFAAVGAANPRFLAQNNLQSIFLGNAYIAVAAIGMSMVIVSGNIDIAVGSLIGVLATLSGSIAVAGWPVVVTWLVAVLGGTGTVIGSTLAAILLAAIGSALIFVNVSPYWIHAVQGSLILVTVLADLTRRRRQAVRR